MNLAQVVGLFQQMLVYPFALLPSSPLPTEDRALVQLEGRDDGLDRTAMSQQRDHDDNDLLGRTQAVEGRAFAGRKGPVAHMADVTAFLLTMHADIALTNLSSCRTVRIGAEYRLRVHELASFLTWQLRNRSMPVDSSFGKSNPRHALMGCYHPIKEPLFSP